ncbi:MAG: PQQ-binding-like beta-propeller repeat protein [Planctomycetaceae bacterium]
MRICIPFPALMASISLILAMIFFTSSDLQGDDQQFDDPKAAGWSQWHGPRRDGHFPREWLPVQLPQALKLLWKVPVGSGHSSPIIIDDSAYLFSRIGDDEVLRAYQLETGELQWEQLYPAPYQVHSAAASHGAGPKSTPAAYKNSLITVGIGGIISCWDLKTHRLRWRQDYTGKLAKTSPLYGTAASPLIVDDAVIVPIGGHDHGSIGAFYLSTGDMKWNNLTEGPSYASPIYVDFDGIGQVITQTQTRMVGLEAEKGKLLWSRDFTTPYDQNSISPVVTGNQVLLAGTGQRTSLLTVSQQGGNWIAITKWSSDEIPLYMSTPVVSDRLLFGFSERRKGHFFCSDLGTGSVRWSTMGREGDNASLFVSGDLLWTLSTDGHVRVFKATSEKAAQLANYQVAQQPTWASPAFAPGMMLVKDADTLYAWSLEK